MLSRRAMSAHKSPDERCSNGVADRQLPCIAAVLGHKVRGCPHKQGVPMGHIAAG